MSLLTSIRNGCEVLIDQNPSTIIITRTTRTDDGAGGYSEATSTLTAQTVRIFNKKTRVLNVSDGGWHSQRVVEMLAKYNADVKPKSAVNTDKFIYNTKTYTIKSVTDRLINGSIACKRCELEEI